MPVTIDAKTLARDKEAWEFASPDSGPHIAHTGNPENEADNFIFLGAANIGDAGDRPATRTDVDVIPEAAIRPSQDTDFHTGRGGAGNAQINSKKEEPAGHDSAEPQYISLADKLKQKLFGKKK